MLEVIHGCLLYMNERVGELGTGTMGISGEARGHIASNNGDGCTCYWLLEIEANSIWSSGSP